MMVLLNILMILVIFFYDDMVKHHEHVLVESTHDVDYDEHALDDFYLASIYDVSVQVPLVEIDEELITHELCDSYKSREMHI